MLNATTIELQKLVRSSPEAMIIVDSDGQIVQVNKKLVTLFGYPAQELTGANLEMLLPEGLRKIHAKYRKQFFTKAAIRPMSTGLDLYGLHKDGTEFPVEVSLHPFQTEDGPLVYAAIRDITEHKRNEAKLQESRDIFQALADNLPEFITMKDTRGSYLFVNKRFEEWTKTSRDRTVGKTLQEIYTPEQAQELAALDRKVIESGKIYTREVEFAYPDGNTRTVVAIRFPITSATGSVLGIGHINHDISERKEAEEALRAAKEQAEIAFADLKQTQGQLVQSQKMASLGKLTAGIAHEIKNPLNFVNNFAETSVELVEELKEEIDAVRGQLNDDARENVDDLFETIIGDLGKINEHGRRADSIVKSMLLHARGDGSERIETPINPLVSEALKLAYHGERARDKSFQVTLEEQFEETAGAAQVMPQEITRVLVNLLGNSFYAVNKRAQAEGNKKYQPTVTLSTSGSGDSIEIRVRDNGTGIPKDIREKLFEPFFTTKPPGEGTGLGLSMCYDVIVSGHGGQMSVDSKTGEFTQFTIMLPRHAGDGLVMEQQSKGEAV
jgi:PAS domain S-box-containing protein